MNVAFIVAGQVRTFSASPIVVGSDPACAITVRGPARQVEITTYTDAKLVMVKRLAVDASARWLGGAPLPRYPVRFAPGSSLVVGGVEIRVDY